MSDAEQDEGAEKGRTGEGRVDAADVDEEADLAVVDGKLGIRDELGADVLGRLHAGEDGFEVELVKVEVDGRRGRRVLVDGRRVAKGAVREDVVEHLPLDVESEERFSCRTEALVRYSASALVD